LGTGGVDVPGVERGNRPHENNGRGRGMMRREAVAEARAACGTEVYKGYIAVVCGGGLGRMLQIVS
jgi:hypothetical protein